MKKLLYVQEHLSCFNYERGKRPVFENLNLKKDEEWDLFSVENLLLFVLDGNLQISFGEFVNKELANGEMMVLPAGCHMSCVSECESNLIVIRLLETKQLCDCYSLDMLLLEKDSSYLPGFYTLAIDKKIERYLYFMRECVGDGLKCNFYLDLKVKELFFLLRAYYGKQELLRLFSLLLSRDISFSDQVLKNHRKVRTVQELADIMNYSLSGFQKRFKRVFGVPGYRWMKEERAKSILHEINNSGKSFKTISDDYGFSSPSHFNDFCKDAFGATPGQLRRNKSFLQAKIIEKD